MRALLPLGVLVLAACDPPLDELYPARFYAFETDGITYQVRAQYDPFERGWFTRVTSIERPLHADDLAFATGLVENDLGPLVCDGNVLDVEPGDIWNPLAGDQIEFIEGPGSFQLVGRCGDAPPARVVIGVFAEPPVEVTVQSY